MGEVHLCRSPGGRLLAVKMVHPHFADDPEFRSRFVREVALSKTVSGAYTAPVVDAAPEAETPWLATAYVPRPSLREAVSAAGPLPEAPLRGLAAGLVEALAAIHTAGLTHRDLKPGNILLSSSGVRVIDFGIARAAEGTAVTRTGQVVGTPGFMSPEQAQGQECAPAGDVFSLGAVLAFACTGVEPFGGDSVASVVYRLLHEEPDLEAVPGGLRETLARCLAKDQDARPSLAELRARFAEGLDQGPPPLPAPVEARIRGLAAESRELLESAPYTPPPRAPFPRWTRRLVPVAALAGGLALVLAAGLLLLPQSGSGGGGAEEGGEAAAEPAFSALEEPPAEPGAGLAEADTSVFEPLTGRPSPHVESPRGLRFAAGGDMLAVLEEGHVAVFEVPSGEFSYQLTTPDARHMAVSPDGGTIAVSGPDRIRMFDARTGEEGETITLSSDSGSIEGIAFATDGEFLALSVYALGVWNPDTGELVTTLRGIDSPTGTDLATSSDGSLLAFGSSEGIEIWTPLGEQVSSFPAETAFQERLAFRPETTLLVSHGGDTIHLWNAVSGERLAEIEPGEYSAVGSGLAIHPDGHYLIASGQEEPLLIDLDARESRGEAALPRPADAAPSDRDTVRVGNLVEFSPEGRYLAAAGSAGLFLWEVN